MDPADALRDPPRGGYRHLGPYSDLVPLAAAQRPLLPPVSAGPELVAAIGAAIGLLDLTAAPIDVRVERRWRSDGLVGEEITWSVGFGPRTHAYVLRPGEDGAPSAAPLPGVVALHCHAGAKWYGKEKIADGPEPPSAEVSRLRTDLYEGRAFANDLARRGFVVLAPDVFLWGSRRFPLADLPGWMIDRVDGMGAMSDVDHYDAVAALHEHVVAKTCGLLGTSLAGVVAAEDLVAAAYLRSRSDVDSDRIGCVGLSGGGARSAMLGAFDPAIRAAAVVAMTSSYADLLDGYVDGHTWMLFPPGLSTVCDWPDVVAARAPASLLVQYAQADELFPAQGMRRADERIAAHYPTGGYTAQHFDAPHRFDATMQEAAFAWLARELQPAPGEELPAPGAGQSTPIR
jgi:dienelactone hydrolase